MTTTARKTRNGSSGETDSSIVREFLSKRPRNGAGKKWANRDLARVLMDEYPIG